MSPLWALLGAAGLLAIVAGRRRSKYAGISPRLWWAEQRMLRTPREILGRLGRVLLVVALLVASTLAALLMLGTLVVAGVMIAGLLAAWWYLRAGARATTPHLYPIERDDLAVGDPVGEPCPHLPSSRALPSGPADDPDGTDALEV
jgi:hypothetical protein